MLVRDIIFSRKAVPVTQLKQTKARNAVNVRSETVTFRLDAKLKFLADFVARNQKRKLGNFVEMAVKEAVKKAAKTIVISDEDEPGYDGKPSSDPINAKTLADLQDNLWSPDEATRFLNVVHIAPSYLGDRDNMLLRILQHSDYFAPSRVLHAGRIQEHWNVLAAIRDGKADIGILPNEQRPSAALAFGLMGDAERIALYKSDPAKFKRDSEAYKKAMKGKK
jgi:hypothetical protein